MMEIELSDNLDCPFCHEKTYRRFIKKNGELEIDFPEYVGICSNKNCQKKCFSPSDYEFAQEQILAKYATNDFAKRVKETNERRKPDAKYPMLHAQYITNSLRNNNLFKYITKKFGLEDASYAFRIYRVRTHQYVKQWQGSAIFYQYEKDDLDNPVAVKVIQYNSETGHRIANEDDSTKDEKDLLYQKSFTGPGCYCLFGHHLLNRQEMKGKPVCIVESEKTALIAAIVYPEAIWMAAGSCYYLYEKKLDADFEGREIILFPDIDVKYEPIDIDEKKGTIRCINWYVIKERFRQELQNNVSVSGFLDSFIEEKCKDCKWNEECSSSPLYKTDNAKIRPRNMGFKLKNNPEITSLPKIVLEDENTKKEMNCPFRGWDLADYILYAKQNNETLASFNELKKVIDEKLLTCIKGKISSLENNIGLTDWINDIQQGIELIEKKEDNTNNKK